MDNLERKKEVNQIVENVEKIDRLQKEALCPEMRCPTICDTCLVTTNNTVPVTFYSCNGAPFTIRLFRCTDVDSPYFRIECIRHDRYVTLRGLFRENGTFTLTDSYMILDLECVCALQCYGAIDLEI